MRTTHCTVAVSLLLLLGGAAYGQTAAAPPVVEFTVFFRGLAIGAEQVSVASTPDGVTISGNERIGPPLNLVTRRGEVRYTADWRPLECLVEGSMGDLQMLIHTTVSGTAASTAVTQGRNTGQRNDEIPADAILLPNMFFGAYEALASRLATAKAGDELRAYVPPQASFVAKVTGVSDDRVRTQDGVLTIHRYTLQFTPLKGQPSNVELWTDATSRLVRLSLPAQGFDIVRKDIASMTTRREAVARPNDEQVSIPSNGFSLTGTLSQPTAKPGKGVKFPAVVLVGSSAPTDRDETLANIPILGELAGALADAGYVVVRYDKRGIGQSGGRAEYATIDDYAEDVIAVVKFLERRKDVDGKRVAVLGYAEGGAVAATAAAREGKIAALVLVASPGVTGAELVLEQQRQLLSRMDIPESEKAAKLELQKTIQQAVITERWPDSVPADLKRQADTPWYRSFLLFDPAKTIRKTEQPILVVQGELDKQVLPSNADKLAEIARSRKKGAGEAVEVVKIPGVNHLLAPAKTGEVDEYDTLPEKKVSPQVASAVTAWLGKTMRAR